VREHYHGPLSLAQDLMVFNVTPDEICVRLAVTPDHVWPNKAKHDAFRSGSRKQRLTMSRWLADQQLFPKF
jgi:ribonuclease Z